MGKVMTDKTRYFNYLINFMQKRLREKCATIDAKVVVVKLYWFHVIKKLKFKQMLYNDEGMKQILQAVEEIPEEIIDYVLLNYVR